MSDEHTERSPAPLRGYRVLSDRDKELVDEIKLAEQAVADLWARIYTASSSSGSVRYALSAEELFRAGFMELVRAVTLPRDPYREAADQIEKERHRG